MKGRYVKQKMVTFDVVEDGKYQKAVLTDIIEPEENL